MKSLFVAFLVFSFYVCSYAQGFVNFNNSPTTLISVQNNGFSTISSAGSYYFALLVAPTNIFIATQFSFTGIYGTNTSTPGMFDGGSNIPVPGWAPGTGRNYYIAGWSGNMGPTWNPAWLTSGPGYLGAFGISDFGLGIAGGPVSGGALPSLDLFGGNTGLTRGFTLVGANLVPEPSTFAFLLIRIGTLFMRRRTH